MDLREIFVDCVDGASDSSELAPCVLQHQRSFVSLHEYFCFHSCEKEPLLPDHQKVPSLLCRFVIHTDHQSSISFFLVVTAMCVCSVSYRIWGEGV